MKIFKLPVSSGGLDKTGQEKAPEKIIYFLDNEIWLNEQYSKPVYETINLDFSGKTGFDEIDSYILENIETNSVYLGGDHSITYSCFKKFSQEHENPCLIVFDAHPDLYSQYDFPTHGDWLKHLIEQKLVKPENIFLIGLRAFSKEEHEYVKKHNIKYIHMKDFSLNDCEKMIKFANSFDAVYLSIDIDVIDPGFAPAAGYLEPGGMTPRQLLHFVQALKNLNNLKAIDLVEIMPDKDFNDMTSKLGAKILGELL